MWLGGLSEIEWVKDKRIEFYALSYRHRQVTVCVEGRPFTTMFKNGGKSYLELVCGDGGWNRVGVNIIPTLSDGRVLMVVEQQAPLSGFSEDLLHILELSGGQQSLDLRKFGEFSSLEFPGGGIEVGESVAIGALSELAAETGIPEQEGVLYCSPHLVFPYPSDLAHGNYISAVYLKSLEFASHVKNDGGLNVLALTSQEIEVNIRNGVFCSMNAGLYMWYWYLSQVAGPSKCFPPAGRPPAAHQKSVQI